LEYDVENKNEQYPIYPPLTQKNMIYQSVVAQSIVPHNMNNRMVKKTINPHVIKPLNINVVKKCLLIGINYTGTNNELEGCINDCETLRNFLVNNRYFTSSEITLMSDFTPGPLYPSKKNIMVQLDSIVKFARKYPSKQVMLFVSYSGHGNYIKDAAKNDINNKEILCPIDFERSGFIIDDELRSKFVNQLPSNVRLIMVFDACHSDTMLDLKYSYQADEKNTYTVIGKLFPTTSNVITISGSGDQQTENKSEYQGSLIASLLANYRDNISYNELISNMRTWLKDNGYNQIPQLSSGKLIEIDTRFLLETFK